MGFCRFLLHPRWRLLFFGLVALGLQVLLLLVSPVQAPVVLYKLALVMLAAILGMFFDVAAFPFAAPDSYLDDDWKRAPGVPQSRCADFPIAVGYRWPFVMACLRRVLVVAACVVAVSVGL
ncbi:putative holin [uncultured Bilophila sp.]|uniref:putative holin n=1 Tax=uncultured Bilophila sp. TaxID=529385 RepID=UPI0026DB84AE|nr:putative holin [uncultured Bilophila sp.]